MKIRFSARRLIQYTIYAYNKLKCVVNRRKNEFAVVELCLSFSSYFEFWLVFIDPSILAYSSFLVALLSLFFIFFGWRCRCRFSFHLFYLQKLLASFPPLLQWKLEKWTENSENFASVEPQQYYNQFKLCCCCMHPFFAASIFSVYCVITWLVCVYWMCDCSISAAAAANILLFEVLMCSRCDLNRIDGSPRLSEKRKLS